MKLDQIAYYAHNEEQVAQIKNLLGLADKDWIEDAVTGRVNVDNGRGMESGHSTGHLRFNYDLGIEVEILTYLVGPHWHESRLVYGQGMPFLSHQGFHLEPGEDFPDFDARLVQEMWTETHTNPYLLERGRKYHYRIYDTIDRLGCYTKFIKRIEQ